LSKGIYYLSIGGYLNKVMKIVKQWNQPITVPKKNASISISFLPTSCRFAKVSYFYVGKKEYSISATN
jgi:hypothetical protein